MPPRDPLTYPKGHAGFESLSSVFKFEGKRPPIGVTQGGSSRKDRGAKPAATTAKFKPSKKPENFS